MRPARRAAWLLGAVLAALLGHSCGADQPEPSGNGRCRVPPCTCDQYGRLTCDCKNGPEELTLTAEGELGLSRHSERIVVRDCGWVSVASHSLAQMDGLVSILVENVSNLSLSRHSLKLSAKASGVLITLRNSSVDVMPSNVFHGDVEAIALEDVRLGRVAAFAFANLFNTNKLSLENSRIEALELQAFKKFEARFLHVIGGSLGEEVPSRAFNDLEVHDKFLLDGVRLGLVRSSAFILRRPRTVAIQNCRVGALEAGAFDLAVRGPVIIKNNSFASLGYGAFLGIRGAEAAGPQHSLRFEDNSLGAFEPGALAFDRQTMRPELSHVLLTRGCACDGLALWAGQLLNRTGQQQGLGQQGQAGPLYCLEDGEPASFGEFGARSCGRLGSSALLLGLAMAGLLGGLGLAGLLLACCCRARRRRRRLGQGRRRRWTSVPTNAPDLVHSKPSNGAPTAAAAAASDEQPVDSRITMVVPDGRLYRETEFHVIVEKAEPLTTEL